MPPKTFTSMICQSRNYLCTFQTNQTLLILSHYQWKIMQILGNCLLRSKMRINLHSSNLNLIKSWQQSKPQKKIRMMWTLFINGVWISIFSVFCRTCWTKPMLLNLFLGMILKISYQTFMTTGYRIMEKWRER